MLAEQLAQIQEFLFLLSFFLNVLVMLHILQYNTVEKEPHKNCKTQSYYKTEGTFDTAEAHKTAT